jgi:hypothetical protein
MFSVIPKDKETMLSPNVSHKEFRCKCDSEFCNFTLFNSDLFDRFEKLRKLCDSPIKITSGFRCVLHNSKTESSARKSKHCIGQALDLIAPERYSLDTFVGMAKQAGFDFIKIYPEDRRIHAHIELK